jgi:hypothetical protein
VATSKKNSQDEQISKQESLLMEQTLLGDNIEFDRSCCDME